MIIEKTKMSSPASTNSCQRFVRNAWKKDLCSNCFKPKEEHAPPPKVEINTLLTWELNDVPPLPSILKSTASKTCKGSGVTFNAEESEVIGYGGNDEFSDDDEDDFFDENPKYEGEDLPDSEYEKELHKLTISNTDFNSVTENLNKDTTENTKPITPLKLGRPDLNQTPAKTVLVTVQPFGSGTTPNKINTKSSIVTSCGLSKTNSVTDGATITKVIPKTILGENVTKTSVNSKTNNTSVVSNSLLKEPGGSNKNSHDLSSLNKSDSQNKVAQSANVNIVNTISSEITSPPKILSWKTLGDQKTETYAQKTERSDIEMKTSAPEGKKPEIVIKFANNDNGANQVKRNNSGTSTESKSRKCLTRGNVITKSHEIVKSKIVQQNKGDLDDTLDSLVDVHDLAEENKTAHDNHVTNINIDSQVHEKTSNIFASKNTFLKKELCEKINDVINKNHQSKLDFMTKDMEPSNDWVTVDSVDCRSEVDGACPDSSLEDASIFTCDREKIGEPDGKADSDSSEHSEPPELPKIPPPYEVNTEIQAEAPPPRSSFLHKKPSSENLELKPKIGIKPNGLLFSIPQQFSSPTTKLNGFLNNSNKDIKINSLKIQSNYVELKKRSGDYDLVNFKTDDHCDNAEKLSTSSDESSKLYKEHEIPSSNNSPETYKLIAEPDSMYYCKDSVRRPSDLNARTGDSTSLNNQKNSKYRTNQTKTVESGLSEMIDSKIIFDKEYENVVKSSCSSRLEPRDDVTDLPNNKVEVNAGKGKYSQGDHQTYANFNDAIDRLNGLEEKFNPIYNYSRSRSNSYDENFSDCVINRCETPLERTKRQAPKPPPTPPPSAIGKKPLPSPSSAKPVVYPKPDLDISPPPRKSSSTDCLTEKYPSDKMLKKMGSSTAATRMRHKFKKLLRIGKEDVEFGMVTSPAPRPRPQIIHPIDYNKPGVEVLRSAGQGMSNKENEIESSNGVPSSHQGKGTSGLHNVTLWYKRLRDIDLARPSKPPPPPRSASLTEISTGNYENVATNPSAAIYSNVPASLDTALSDDSSSSFATSPDTSVISDLSLPSLSTSPLPDHTSYSSVTFSSPTSTFYCPSNQSPTRSVALVSVSTPTPGTKVPDHASNPLSSAHTLNVPPLISTPTLPNKPARPPPPKAAEYLKRQTASTPANTNEMGDVTTSILDSPGPTPPIKPQRTASLRDSKKMKSSPDDESKTNPDYTAKPCSDYESRSGEFDGKSSADCASNDSGHGLSRSESDKTSNISEDHLYEVINRRNSDPPSPSDASSSDQRSLSYQYAGSETESDIYYPYVFYGNDEGSEDGWKGARVRVRRSRNVVHKTLEDNYGAVVIANHEALAQMLEQMNQNFITPPPSLKSLKTSPIRFRDLTINEASKLTLGGRNFYTASYDGLSFAVALCGGPGLHSGKSLPPACVLSPVAEFIELIPSALVCSERTDSALQATVSILPCSYISSLHLHIQSSTSHKDLCLVLLQLVSAALSLAACGIEDTAAALDEFVVCGMEDKTSVPRLCVVPCADQPISRISLCSCVRKAVSLLLPLSPLSPLLLDLLSAESSLCLSQVKSVLEFWLWGPEDLRENEDKQVALQRWLDLDRATCLHSLVCSRPPALSPPDYSHLSFLVRTNSKALSESDSLLSDIRNKQKEY